MYMLIPYTTISEEEALGLKVSGTSSGGDSYQEIAKIQLIQLHVSIGFVCT